MDKLHLDQHTSQSYNQELEFLRSSVLEMGGKVQTQVNDSINALINADSGLAEMVRDKDREVNQMEVTIDEACMRILARRQPAASDLRLVFAASKATTDLERIGDESKRIAKLAITMSEKGESPRGYVEARHISQRVSAMLNKALDAFARLDVDIALEVARADKEVDMEYGTALRELITFMMEEPRNIKRVMDVIWALRALERVGDHARNIAELVIYLVKGEDVRHASYEQMEASAHGE